MSETCENDVSAWASEQVSLLRSCRLSEIEVDHIAEEIEGVGKAEAETDISEPACTSVCPWAFEQIMDPDFWPQ